MTVIPFLWYIVCNLGKDDKAQEDGFEDSDAYESSSEEDDDDEDNDILDKDDEDVDSMDEVIIWILNGFYKTICILIKLNWLLFFI